MMIAFRKCKNRVAIALFTGIALSGYITEAQTNKVPRIGWLSVQHGPRISLSFKQGLRELGWFVGENIAIETRFANERYGELPRLAAELVRQNVDVIVTADAPVIPAVKHATTTIPIVMAVVGDPVALGYVKSLARPGGNITGLSLAIQLYGKRLELLKEAVRAISRVAIFDTVKGADWKKRASVNRTLGLQVNTLRIDYPDDLERAFKTVLTERADALMVLGGPQTRLQRHRIVEFASRKRLPAMYARAIYVRDGGLMSYGVDIDVMFRRAAYYVDRILKGAKPFELPVERSMAAEFVVNLKAAKEIGVNIPAEVLQRANEVIQ